MVCQRDKKLPAIFHLNNVGTVYSFVALNTIGTRVAIRVISVPINFRRRMEVCVTALKLEGAGLIVNLVFGERLSREEGKHQEHASEPRFIWALISVAFESQSRIPVDSFQL